MTLDQMRYFVTAAQLQNLSKAAEALHISQPSLSRSIARLEAELGAPLFCRQGKRVVLNEPGSHFLSSAQVVLRELDSALVQLRTYAGGAGARLSVGLCGPDEPISACLAAFSAAHPQITLDLDCSIEAKETLDINQYDMLLCPDTGDYQRFRGIPLREECYLLALAATHPLADHSGILPKDLAGQPFVFLRRGQMGIADPYDLCAGLNLGLRTACLTDDREQHRQLVAAGIGLGFVPEGCAGPYQANPALRLLPIRGNKFRRRLMLCFKRDKHLSPAGQTLRTFVLDYFQLNGATGQNGTI